MEISVSIIVPAYKEGELINACLHSVGVQKYKGALECIIVDDCGEDGTMQVVDSFISEYSGDVAFRVVHHRVNSGVSAARNTGIHAAKGDYIYFLDSDDQIKLDCIQKMVDCVNRYPDVDAVFAGADVVGRDWQFMDYTRKSVPQHSNNPLWIKATMLERFILSMTPWNRLVKRTLLIDNNLFFVEGIIHEDELWNFSLAKKVTSIAVLYENTYVYTYRETGITATESNLSKLRNMIPIWREMVNSIDPVLPDAQAKSICRQILEWPMWRLPFKERFALKRLLSMTCRYVGIVDQMAVLCYAVLGSITFHVPMLNRFVRERFHFDNTHSCEI